MLHNSNVKFYHTVPPSSSKRNIIFREKDACIIITLNCKLLNSAGVTGSHGLLCPHVSISKDF